jgi:hypothetical protein
MMMRTIIRSDEVSYPWLAPAGTRRGVVDNAIQLGYISSTTGEFQPLSVNQALRDVLRTVDIFKCQPDGAVKIEIDEYLEQALARKSIDRVIGKIAPVNELTAAEVSALASGNVDVFRAARKEAAARGKTRLNVVKKKSGTNKTDASEKELKLAREMIVTISQNIDIIKFYGGSTIEEAFALMDADGTSIQDDVTEQFGVPYTMVKELVLSNFINRDLLDLKFA